MDKIQENQLVVAGGLTIFTGAVAMVSIGYTEILSVIIFGTLMIIYSQLAKDEDYVEGKYTNRVLRANKR